MRLAGPSLYFLCRSERTVSTSAGPDRARYRVVGIATGEDFQRRHTDMHYVSKIPKMFPAGKVLVHNHVSQVTPSLRPGIRGFRA